MGNAKNAVEQQGGQQEQERRKALHYSHLSSLAKCGHAFFLSYVEKLKVPPGIALAVGTSVHDVAAKNLTAKSLGNPTMSLEQVRDESRKSFDVEWGKGVGLSPEEVAAGLDVVKGEAIDKTVRLAGLHATAFVPTLRPSIGGVERQWRISVDGFPFDLCGTADLIEKRETDEAGNVTAPSAVRDLKTSKASPNKNIAGVSAQLSMYAMAVEILDEEAPDTVALDYLIDNKTPKALTLQSERRPEHIEALWHRIENAALVIEKEIYTPADPATSWWCAPTWCGYARTNPDTGKPYCKFYADAPVTVAFDSTSSGATAKNASPATPAKKKGASKNGNASELTL